jgi:DNA-binding NtrC family response regulator
MPERIVVLDPTEGALGDLLAALRSSVGEEFVTGVRSLPAVIKAVDRSACDVAVVDFALGDGERRGEEVIRALRADHPELLLVAVAEHGDVALAASAVSAGASDFLVRGTKLCERIATLLSKLRRQLDIVKSQRRLREELRLLSQGAERRFAIIGESAVMDGLRDQIRRVAGIPRPVLIMGERGTGKELVARAIHRAAGPADRPFVAVNCAAFPEGLLESELFGHERGAFTGAERRTQGRFELAAGGTIFLDEIGNMSLAFQQKVLRVVEYGAYNRVGGSEEQLSTARLLAATNTDLHSAIAGGRFLQDLYDRLAFEVVEVPPLRERATDVALLAQYFLDEFLREVPALGQKRLSDGALDLLAHYQFPGNVRELRSIVERAAYRDRTSEIGCEDIGWLPVGGENGRQGFEEQVDTLKRRLLTEAFLRSRGSQRQAAASLGLSYHRYRYYHHKYAIAAALARPPRKPEPG